MSQPEALRIDELKPHFRAIIDEVRRAGPAACRQAHYDARKRFEQGRAFEAKGHPDCGSLHVLAAVALEISMAATIDGDDDAIDWLLESISMDSAASACEAAHTP
jgi:hypothetical protein